MARGDRDEPELGLLHLPCSHAADDEEAIRHDRQRQLDRRAARQLRPDELRRREGRNHRLHEIARPRAGLTRRPRERRRPRLRQDAADRRDSRGRPRADAHEHAARAARGPGRRRRGGTVSLLRRGLVHHGRGAAGRRRTGDVMGVNGNGKRRVVVTGVGMVSSLGSDAETSWSNLIAGQSGVGEITQFDHTDYPVHFAAELKDFQPTDWVNHKSSRRMDRYTQMILAAARQAEADSGIDIAADAVRVGASVATGIGGLRSFQDCYDVLLHRGPDRISPFSIPCIIPNMGAGWVSIELGTKGPLMSQCTACAASNMAIGDAMDEIRLGRADVMIAGGTEAPITRVGIAGFDAMRALSRRNDDPERASRPFDRDRDGLVMGEAGAVLVLEELEHARARGAKVYAEVAGYGTSADASHITEPDPTGASPARAMLAALADAGVAAEEIGYVNAHATSTPIGDAAETKVIKMALGEEQARRTPISSTKGATGHCFGAAGAIEAIFTTLALKERLLPPTINLETPDPECDLDYIANVARPAPGLEIAVSNSFGFGGHNATIVLRRWPDQN